MQKSSGDVVIDYPAPLFVFSVFGSQYSIYKDFYLASF